MHDAMHGVSIAWPSAQNIDPPAQQLKPGRQNKDLRCERAVPCLTSQCLYRLERALEELGGFRKAAGRSTTPDFNEEDRLRADLHTSEAQKRQLGQDSQALATLVLNLAHKQALPGQSVALHGRLWPWPLSPSADLGPVYLNAYTHLSCLLISSRLHDAIF